jgi:hypothetical protein
MAGTEAKLCPSHRCRAGSQLLGVRQEDGTIAILPQALPVTADFIEQVSHHEMPPEQRFRFANKCIEGGCGQWTGTTCGVADKWVKQLHRIQPAEELPACSIRPRCRWYSQNGADACQMCPYVLTEITEKQLEEIGVASHAL